MINLNNIKDTGNKSAKCLGRGPGSGRGKTCTHGHKGQKARSGVALNGFEGGQNPIYQRLPKRGFKSRFGRCYLLTFRRLESMIKNGLKVEKDKILNLDLLKAHGFVAHYYKRLRFVNSEGSVLDYVYEVNGISKTALSKIEKAGGKFKKV